MHVMDYLYTHKHFVSLWSNYRYCTVWLLTWSPSSVSPSIPALISFVINLKKTPKFIMLQGTYYNKYMFLSGLYISWEGIQIWKTLFKCSSKMDKIWCTCNYRYMYMYMLNLHNNKFKSDLLHKYLFKCRWD